MCPGLPWLQRASPSATLDENSASIYASGRLMSTKNAKKFSKSTQKTGEFIYGVGCSAVTERAHLLRERLELRWKPDEKDHCQ